MSSEISLATQEGRLIEAQKSHGEASPAAVKVSARALAKSFGAYQALRNVDLEIRSGEFLTLLGPSGCGKTTLMRIIAGLETSDSGTIAIDGRDVTHAPPRHRGLGMVFQNYSLFPHMTVADNIGYGLAVKGRPKAAVAARVAAMLDLIRLPQVADRKPAALSGGQQQRVALARALATEPSLLMLDEPLGALDLKLRRQLQGELKRIHRETGMTFLFVTHDQEEALFLSDRIAVMRDGRIEQLDVPDAIYHRPVNDYVADFIGDVTLLPCSVDATDRSRAHAEGWPGAAAITLAEPARHETFRLVVRPEQVRLAPRSGIGLPAAIEEVINEGSTTLVLLRSADGHGLKARLMGRPSFDLSRRADVDAIVEGAGIGLPAASS
ncbi:ABC transporter ATP-binding protein [Phreatobacter stygius]|uniref:ABC transporter ATP-binding protein n=1 Tax=Phreatobacter stygius TaxID=1940610 RepID=A0A4D7B949_9HYPH|nr:ABC transporter ATP-binding protein [Phreatobacter stygius]QCI67020.1 ABC transporter ATP-binding protein [Phreatobacter stygius]